MNDPKSSDTALPRRARRYDDVFKRHAVSLVVDQGRPVRAVAQELGISEFLLYDWRRTLRPDASHLRSVSAPAAVRSPAELEAENAALRRELEYVRQQRDILKKTLGILSEPSANASSGSRR